MSADREALPGAPPADEHDLLDPRGELGPVAQHGGGAGNGLQLDQITPGLSALATELTQDRKLVTSVRALGELYLTAQGTTLVHGDYYPGSWLRAPEPWVIDPEFGFYGPPEFDLGVMLAHLQLADQPPELAESTIARYRRSAPMDPRLTRGFAGVEVIRRLLGVAQLPVGFDLDAKRALIADAREHLARVDR